MRTMMLCVATLALALSGAACKKGGDAAGGGDPCTYKSKCAKADPLTAEKTKECQDGIADKACGTAYKAMVTCTTQNDKCTAEGEVDDDAVMTACAAQIGAYFECAKSQMAPATP